MKHWLIRSALILLIIILVFSSRTDADLSDGLNRQDHEGLNRFLSDANADAAGGLEIKSINIRDDAGFIATAVDDYILINSRLLRGDTEGIHKSIKQIIDALQEKLMKGNLSNIVRARAEDTLARIKPLLGMPKEEMITSIIVHETGAHLGFSFPVYF